ncbi:glycosyltransferase family 2 protein [Flavobacterium reichenbachii]|uniref:Alpha-L-Rha alpha-1,3-L-rhamnosyltransferase n=1 Tax=Flavobacterium reichenbachii TaxID=362418 RepID=A0A085ZLA6_9FLAO|nr:glycosyltransferase family 2 protein [Flavobacterium reichenbachii]KFF05220.1 alpha-L-Rha alpha-1,3-L-rhamnosyltransferase [Flavobacterium reichenbachii]OXB16113.1 alpha-L-Rha alpha-1,3-L-rhamnosyltransferase [Flavobacterium reichenbachii]
MISVCVPTYNGEKYIREQLNSILCQIGEKDEIIISDDGSSDLTVEILNSYNDKRIKIFHHVKHKKPKSKFRFNLTTRNIENALKNANGDIIFMADQDDVWEKNRIEKILPYLNDYSLVLNDCKVVDEDKKSIHESYFQINKSNKGFFKNLIKNSYLGCCMAFTKESMDFFYPFPKVPIPHDIWIGLMNEIYGRVHFLDEKLVLYRRHGNNLSYSSGASNFSFWYKMEYRIILLFAILLKLIKKK